jgi:hypothetical protein
MDMKSDKMDMLKMDHSNIMMGLGDIVTFKLWN